MLRLESPAVDGKSCASVCTRYRTDYRFRYRGVATRILQSARHDRSGRVRERKGAREAPRGLKPKPGTLWSYGVQASSVRAAALGIFSFGRYVLRPDDKQTNNAAKASTEVQGYRDQSPQRRCEPRAKTRLRRTSIS